MRLKSMVYIMVAVVVISLIGTLLIAGDNAKKDDAVTCILSGKKVAQDDARGPVNYDGKDYFFCCNSCLEKFKADPAKYIANADKLKTYCCGSKTVDEKTAIKSTHNGKDYYFCNETCKAAFDKDPEAYLKKMDASKTHPCLSTSGNCAHKCAKVKRTSSCAKKE